MNTKVLMTASSIVLAVGGAVSLFAPETLMGVLGLAESDSLAVLIQLLGAGYFAFAMMNWTAKESVIGGIYNRPLSVGNFGHFLIGTLVLARDALSNGARATLVVVLLLYALFAAAFWWLVFRHSGISGPSAQEGEQGQG